MVKSRYKADFSGKVSYGHKVIMSIISLATLEIRGVHKLQGKQIRTEINGDMIKVDVYIDVMYGYSCADVAFKVQESVRRSLESMTKYRVGTINVNVLGVCFDEE